jgi:hypothetical protein
MPKERNFRIRWIGLAPGSQVEAIGVEVSHMNWVEQVLEVTLEEVPQSASWQLVVIPSQ